MTDLQYLIDVCQLKSHGDKIEIRNRKHGAKHIEEIKARRQEILDYFAQEQAAAEAARKERQDKIDAIEGLRELETAIDAERRYNAAFNAMMSNEYNDGACPPAQPKASPAELKTKYPRAAAYLKAEAWTLASHYAKYGAGKRAKERIINGEDYAQVIADMEAEWSAHCKEHVWD